MVRDGNKAAVEPGVEGEERELPEGSVVGGTLQTGEAARASSTGGEESLGTETVVDERRESPSWTEKTSEGE